MAILRTSLAGGVLCAVAALTACSSNHATQATGAGGSATTGSTGGATGTGGDGTGGAVPFTPATHPALPQVITFGGPVLAAPKVQPIAYKSDTGITDMEAFLQELTTSTFWSQTTSEYGVGPLTVLPTIYLTEPPPATINNATVTQGIITNTSGANPAWGAADGNTVYLWLVPPGQIISDPGNVGCTDFDGFHDEVKVGAISVPYAVGCSCPGFDGKGVTDIQERTVAVSHELVEAATNPLPNSNTAYGQEDNANIVWTIVSGGELADMCEFNQDSYAVPTGSKYMIQRSWSNKAAKASQNPCRPLVTTQPYFNSYPVLPDMVSVSGGGTTITTPGVKIPVGTSKVVDVNLFSEAATTGPWTVSAYDYNYFTTGANARMTFAFDKTTGVNGDVLHLTITVKSVDPQLNVEPFIIFSDLGKPGDASFQENIWMGTVAN